MTSQLTDREKINKVKRDFKDYKYNTKLVFGWQLRIDDLNSKINNYKASPIVIPNGTTEYNSFKNSPFFDEIEELERRISEVNRYREPIDNFKERLSKEDNFILDKIFFDVRTWSYRKLSSKLYKAEITLKRDVDKLCLKYWYSVHAK